MAKAKRHKGVCEMSCGRYAYIVPCLWCFANQFKVKVRIKCLIRHMSHAIRLIREQWWWNRAGVRTHHWWCFHLKWQWFFLMHVYLRGNVFLLFEMYLHLTCSYHISLLTRPLSPNFSSHSPSTIARFWAQYIVYIYIYLSIHTRCCISIRQVHTHTATHATSTI